MHLKDVLIMEVPAGALKEIIKKKNINAKINSIEEMATAVNDYDDGIANELANEFKFAGRTSLNFNIMMNSIPDTWKDKQYFKQKLVEKYGDAILSQGTRPELDKIPKLIKVYEKHEKLILAFSFLGSPKRYLENFEIVSRCPQMVEYVIIHFSPFAVEVRAKAEQNKLFCNAVLDIMDIPTEKAVWDKVTKLTEEQANKLARNIGARLRSAKHKMLEGVYATKEVTAHTQIQDLQSTKQYQEEFGEQPMKRKTLVFKYEYSFGYEDNISYVITDEGLLIRSKVGEEAISHLLKEILKIRFPVGVDNVDELVGNRKMVLPVEEQLEILL
ncbi:hypothetical protein [Bacillus wiedmannii]|uniref:hypothetical protein n=1 Tax=Bacillus wiedmannii TaxID=1890302 RepID=UPI000B4B33E0|nr:hypothetical protein [Bacillus wiedmannii]